jgi:transmembrane sensor
MTAKKTPRRQTASEVDLAAAGWAARADRGLSPAEDAALGVWLAGDPRRPGAYAKALGISLHARRAAALGPAYRPADFAAPRSDLSRRTLMAGVGGGLAAAAAAAVAVTAGLARNERYATRLGEVRTVALQDGSVVTLNTQSTIAVAYSRGYRRVHLIAGEALFDVAKDASRPFVVSAGLAQVRAVGTSFTVSCPPAAPVEVLVREGIVEVGDAAARKPIVLRLGASEKATVSQAAITGSAVSEAEVNRRLSWRDGQLSFGGETLAEAAAEYARYSDVRIVIDDPALRARPIVGLYQTNDPVGFAKAVATAFNARVEVGAGEVRITP